jgi:hypothetical protein
MASPAEDLADSVKSSAEKKVRGKAVDGGKDKGGIDCFALVDELLGSTGGKRPKSIGTRVSEQIRLTENLPDLQSRGQKVLKRFLDG